MLARIKFSLLSQNFTKRTIQRISKLCLLQRGYRANSKNIGCYQLIKAIVYKSNNVILPRRINSISEENLLVHKKKDDSILSFLWETVLITIRIIVITTAVSGLLLFYWITRVFGLGIFPVIYLKTIEFLGPTFIKLGQWMSTRRDLYPEELCSTLSLLQRNTSAHSWYYTERMIEAAYGPDWREIFYEFDPVPIGSGCCAQVYKASMKPGIVGRVVDRDARASIFVEIAEYFYIGYLVDYIGKIIKFNYVKTELDATARNNPSPVAVKVLHPHIKERLNRDLKILRSLSKIVTHLVPSLEWLSINDCIDEFVQIMEKQVDLSYEAENLTKFSKNFSNVKEVNFPKPYKILSNGQILVETYHEGRPINDYVYEENQALRHKLAKIGLNTVFKMIFKDNFVHCDLHPGNMLVQESFTSKSDHFSKAETSPRIIILDCGLVTEMNEACKKNFRDVFQSVVMGDGRRAADLMMTHSMCESTDPVGFKDTMDGIVKKHLQKGIKLENVNQIEIFQSCFEQYKDTSA